MAKDKLTLKTDSVAKLEKQARQVSYNYDSPSSPPGFEEARDNLLQIAKERDETGVRQLLNGMIHDHFRLQGTLRQYVDEVRRLERVIRDCFDVEKNDG